MDPNGWVGQGRPQAPGANYARPPVKDEFTPIRARQSQAAPEYLEEDEPRRGHPGVKFLLALVLLAALFVAGLYFVLPARDAQEDSGIISTLNDVKDAITKEAELLARSVKDIVAPEVKEPARVQDFQVAPATGQAPVELAFTLTTTKTVEGVRIADDQGNVLAHETVPFVDEENRLIWSLKLPLQEAYSGIVEAQVKEGEAWIPSGKTVQLSILAPTVAPVETLAPTPELAQETPAPTLEAQETPAPTEIPTEAPTEVPTQEPTEAPTPEATVTPAPTQAPTPSPAPIPLMTAGAVEGTDPSQIKLTSAAYSGGKKASDFARTAPVNMNGPAGYSAWQGAVLTFRGSPFRQNAAYGTVDVKENKLEIAWSSPMGGISSYHGAGWPGQPAIVKWTKEVREMMNISPEKKAVTALKEVIMASQDGNIYFLDLADGQATRDPIHVGYPLKSSVSIDPRGMPMLMVGQSVSIIGNKTGAIGYFVFNLINQKQMMFINGRDKNAYFSNGAFDGSALLDLNSDTMIVAGENGLLYTVALNTKFDVANATLSIDPKTAIYKSKTSKQEKKETGIEGSVAMYGNYAYFADATGILQCVDVNTMKPVWAVDTDDNTDASIALDYEADGSLALYTGNTVKKQGKKGVCTIRRLNALTGEQIWSYPVKVDFDSDETGGCMASPVVGQQSIGNLVIFTVAKTPEGGAVIAFDKKTGNVVWQQTMAHFSWSSPVTVYNENGDAWIIQGDSEGVLQLMDGQTGAVMNSLQLEGAITASPAVYNNMLVVGTSGKGVSKIYGITIK
jgi:outer membrane protein assembly factor BamB